MASLSFKHVLIDIGPLRSSPGFRRLWTGSLLSSVGGQMSVFAVSLQVFTITNSSIAVGAIGLFVAIPTILFSLVGGAIADSMDRKKLMLIISGAQLLIAGLFAVQSLANLNQIWILFCLVAAQSTLGAFAVPARRTFFRALLDPVQMPAAMALYLFSMHAGQILGPVLAGGAIAGYGFFICYICQALGFLASLYAVIRLPPMPPAERAEQTSFVASIRESLVFVKKSAAVRGAFVTDLAMTLLGVPFALFPAINAEHFGGGAETLGFLVSAVAVGSLMGTLFSGFTGRITKQGGWLILSCIVWGVMVLGFGLSSQLILSIAFLLAMGFVDVIALTLGQTIIQNETPDAMRGRVGALEHMVQMGGPQLGNMRAGIVGALAGSPAGVIVGAATTIAALGALAFSSPEIRHYRKPEPANSQSNHETAQANP